MYVSIHECELNIVCILTIADSRVKIWRQLNAFKSPMASTADRSKAVVLLLLIHCFCCFHFCGVFEFGPALFSFMVLQSFSYGRENWLLYFNCLLGVL